MPNQIIPYKPYLKNIARELRKQRILSEVVLWNHLKGKALGVEFHRQVPMLDFIVDFYCHELKLVIEIDGGSHAYEETVINDAIRQQRLEAFGVVFLRFEDQSVRNELPNVMLAIAVRVEELMMKKKGA
jgi:very-short-patch-repair endonuclease